MNEWMKSKQSKEQEVKRKKETSPVAESIGTVESIGTLFFSSFFSTRRLFSQRFLQKLFPQQFPANFFLWHEWWLIGGNSCQKTGSERLRRVGENWNWEGGTGSPQVRHIIEPGAWNESQHPEQVKDIGSERYWPSKMTGKAASEAVKWSVSGAGTPLSKHDKNFPSCMDEQHHRTHRRTRKLGASEGTEAMEVVLMNKMTRKRHMDGKKVVLNWIFMLEHLLV